MKIQYKERVFRLKKYLNMFERCSKKSFERTNSALVKKHFYEKKFEFFMGVLMIGEIAQW